MGGKNGFQADLQRFSSRTVQLVFSRKGGMGGSKCQNAICSPQKGIYEVSAADKDYLKVIAVGSSETGR